MTGPASKFRTADLVLLHCDRDSIWATPRHGQGVLRLPASLANVVVGLTRFRRLDEHADAAAQRLQLSPEQRASLLRDLTRLAQSGALISDDSVRARALSAPESAPNTVRAVAVTTRDRPELVLRALSTRIGIERERAPHYHVFDDSRDGARRETLQQRLAELARPGHVRLGYVGPEQKSAFVTALRQDATVRDLDPRILGLLLQGEPDLPATGANRNAVRLLLAGEPLCLMDDDVTGRSAPLPNGSAGLALSSAGDPTSFHFFEDEAAAVAFAGVSERPLLDEHERWLGRGVRQCLAALPADAPLELDDASSGLVAALDNAWVAVTANGVAGDSGMASPAYYLLLAGDNLARLCERYGTYRSTRALVRAPARTTLCDAGFFMAPSCCLDERLPLPPFFPVQRNSDAVFAAMLRTLTPSALIAHLPSVVEHRPEPPRRFVDGVFFAPESASTSDFMLQACYAFEAPKWFSEAERAEAFVHYLRSLGRLTSAEFGDFFRVERLKQLARLSQRLSEQYTQATLPELRMDIEKELARIQAAVRGPLELSPQDFPRSGAAPLERIQRLLVDFAAIVEAWPTLLDAARALRSSGRTFALPLAAP